MARFGDALVGVGVMNDGSLLVVDDGSRTVWRVSYPGPGTKSTTAAY